MMTSLMKEFGLEPTQFSVWKETFGDCIIVADVYRKFAEMASSFSDEDNALLKKLGGYRGIFAENLATWVDERWPLFMKSSSSACVDNYGLRFKIDTRIHSKFGFAWHSDFVKATELILKWESVS